MNNGDSPPPTYQRLPPISSETFDKYRWPSYQSTEPYIPKSVKTSVDGPSQSPQPGPFLHYHRQSTYADEYVKQKPFTTHTCSAESRWIDPVGKHGDFIGLSTYEKDYKWPDVNSKMMRIPLVSTIGLGILPIVGTKGDSNGSVPAKKDELFSKDVGIQCEEDERKRNISKKKYYPPKDFVPLQDIWAGETTYKANFQIPPKYWKTERCKPPTPELKISGDMQTATSTMLDYQDPKFVMYDEEKFANIPKFNKDDNQHRHPFFLF